MQAHNLPGAGVLYKLVIVGEPTCGKTSFVERYVNNTFSPGHIQTIGVEFAAKTIPRADGESTVLQLWDIGGQERYGQMMRVYLHRAVGAVVVCDSQRLETMDRTARWKQEIDNRVWLPDGSPLPCILVVNKRDLGPCERSEEEVAAFAEEHGFVGVHYTSALTGDGVEEAMADLVSTVVRLDEGGTFVPKVDGGVITPDMWPSPPVKHGCRC